MDDAEAVGPTFLQRVGDALRTVSPTAFAQAVDLLERTRVDRRRVYVMGNGGSASIAEHLGCDLSRRSTPSGGLRVHALTGNSAVLTARANDNGYERVFADQLELLADPGDVVVAVSVSGHSANILTGLSAARHAGARSIGLFGSGGGSAGPLVDIPIIVSSTDYGAVETVHLAIGHALAAALGTARGPVGLADPGRPATNPRTAEVGGPAA